MCERLTRALASSEACQMLRYLRHDLEEVDLVQ